MNSFKKREIAMAAIPTKNIHIYWNDPTPPDFVARCVATWRKSNPLWTVNLLNEAVAAAKYPDHPPGFQNLGNAHKSDWIRLRHMEAVGGVYVDATCVSTAQSVDRWVDMEEPRVQGFKVRPARGRKPKSLLVPN